MTGLSRNDGAAASSVGGGDVRSPARGGIGDGGCLISGGIGDGGSLISGGNGYGGSFTSGGGSAAFAVGCPCVGSG